MSEQSTDSTANKMNTDADKTNTDADKMNTDVDNLKRDLNSSEVDDEAASKRSKIVNQSENLSSSDKQLATVNSNDIQPPGIPLAGLMSALEAFGNKLVNKIDESNRNLIGRFDTLAQTVNTTATTSSVQTNQFQQTLNIQNIEFKEKPVEPKAVLENEERKQFYCKVKLDNSVTVNSIKERIRENNLLKNSYLKVVNTYVSRDKKDFVLVSKTDEANEKLKEEIKKFGFQLSDENTDQNIEKWCIYGYPTNLDDTELKMAIINQENRACINDSTIEVSKSTKANRIDSCAIISYKSAATIDAIRAHPYHFVDLKEHRLTKWTPIVICKRCCEMHHTAEVCDKQPRCVKCAEPHAIGSCMNLNGESKCFNCMKKYSMPWKAKHGALSMVCYARRDEMDRIYQSESA